MSPRRVPLFPLNTVLFPGMPLPLHVFEERFRKLVERCVDAKEPFGVILATDPDERGIEIARVGTIARIHAVQRLHEGRFNLLAVGDERFYVLRRTATADGYDEALVEPLSDMPGEPEHLAPLANQVRRLFDLYFGTVVQRAGLRPLDYELPEDPENLSFVVAAILQLPLPGRQELLESTSTAERLQQEIACLERDMARAQEIAEARTARPLDAESIRREISKN
ncbi:MAG: LON peptidase substrate-binding domain-containing protein [Chthonomonadales bacterium]|nr:LON peptidase substrate-binding domain-containing protein [Chthonomonadales bacterium]